MIRILVVEDSPVQRDLLLFILEQESDFSVVGTAPDGIEAIALTEKLRPDIILMDCHMPRLNGIEATKQIMEKCPTPIIIVSATLMADDVLTTFDAIKIGALAVLSKPAGLGSAQMERDAAELVRTLRLMSDVKVVRRRAEPVVRRESTLNLAQNRLMPKPGVIAIAGSTGAPAVIADILTAIGPALPVPVLIVQHMARGFIGGFATWLGQRGGAMTRIGEQGVRLQPGYAYLAPDDFHMGIDRAGRIELSESEEEEGFRPSANFLFRSIARSFGPAAIGVLLTGMGRDGAAGLTELRQAGGMTLAQDEASCVVYGMPREAVRLGGVVHVMSPGDIARFISSCFPAERESNSANQG